jgi:hypothetical protein
MKFYILNMNLNISPSSEESALSIARGYLQLLKYSNISDIFHSLISNWLMERFIFLTKSRCTLP